jgi:hypothetical protein
MQRPRNKTRDLIGVIRLNRPNLRKADPELHLGHLAEPERMVEVFYDRLDAIEKDPRLTPQGRADAGAAAGHAAIAALQKWYQGRVGNLDDVENATLQQLWPLVRRARPTDTVAAVSEALIRHEIRLSAAGLNDIQVETLFRQGDAVLREALLEAPRVHVGEHSASLRPFIEREKADEILLEDAARMRPDLGDSLHDIRELRSMYETVAATVKSQVDEHVNINMPEHAPVAPSAIRTGATTIEATTPPTNPPAA